MASKSVCTSTVVVPPDNTEKYPDDSEPAGDRDIQMEYSSD